MEFTGLEYPDMRSELIDYLSGLSDIDYQKNVWVRHLCKAGFHDELDYAIHFLYDDTCLARDPVLAIGLYLNNMKEVDAIKALVDELDNVFSLYGLDLSDREYIEKPEWFKVVDCAIKAKQLLTEG